MKIGLTLSLALGSVPGEILSNLFDQFIKFEPLIFIYDTSTGSWDQIKHKKKIRKYSGDVFLAANDEHGNVFSVGPTNKRHSYISLTIKQEMGLFLPSDDEINQVLNSFPGLISAYLYNADYVDVQSAKFSNNLMGREWPKE